MRASPRHHSSLFWFCLPALLLSVSVIALPAIATYAMSLTDWDGVSEPWYIGFENYQDLFADRAFWSTMVNNGRWLIIFLTIPMALALFVSALLTTRRKAAAVYQAIFLLPFVISPVANVGIWMNVILDNNAGLLGWIDRNITPVGYPLGDPDTALYTVAAVNIWSFWGYLAVILFAAMRQTPEDQLEAAYLEGANGWQIFREVTLPNILPTVALLLALVTILSFLNFDYVFLMTGGGPAGSTEMLSTLAYGFAFRTFEVGKAAAVAVVMSGFGILASFAYIFVSREALK
ncbi:carbohydrate ABC transporter permease [Salipiger sp. PrR002]|uniref:carbohydrate ABC transporter permease n=1 Tax=Salipiger sp. PrR002 TaxID=2706489 RepID=UPI0013B715AC|nr:sugar ABC transporter permease [Salipiger sp. PrR002]NDW00082.1 sugar ABC transporter permease [Salipiger sp. PrR002]NDW56909.1 sugar ABC transporter permease [Salipiger sp. PrR004]